MAEEPRKEEQLSDEELESQEAEELLGDRERPLAGTGILDPGPMPLPAASSGLEPIPWSDGEAPDDRYEQ